MPLRKNAAPSDQPPLPVVPVPNETCHRFMIPFTMPAISPATKEMVGMNAQMAFVGCIKEKCALWNKDKKECLDATQAKALDKIAGHLGELETLQRLPQDMGN